MELNSLKPYEFWEYIKSPKFVCAPMVDQSELTFRLLVRKYNCHLAYTPMIHSVLFSNKSKYQEEWLSDLACSDLDRPRFVQFCGHDPEMLLNAAKIVEGKCEAVDINLGCPQHIAKRGNYGAFLLDDTATVLKIAGYLANNLKHSAVSCKIRLFDDINSSIELCRKLEDVGVKVIAVHGRTKIEKKLLTKSCNWDAISAIKSSVNIPIIANGGIGSFEDIIKCFEITKADAVMSSEKLLELPSLFQGTTVLDIDDISLEYLKLAEDYNYDSNFTRSHLFKFYYKACRDYPEFNERIAKASSLSDFYSIANDIKILRKDIPPEEKLGYYLRYRTELKNKNTILVNNDENYDIGDIFVNK